MRTRPSWQSRGRLRSMASSAVVRLDGACRYPRRPVMPPSRSTGAIFVLPTTTEGQQGPVAGWISTSGWAAAADACTRAGVGRHAGRRRRHRRRADASRGASSGAVRSRGVRRWMPTVAKTAIKDAREWRRARQFHVDPDGPWTGSERRVRLATPRVVPHCRGRPRPGSGRAAGAVRPGRARVAGAAVVGAPSRVGIVARTNGRAAGAARRVPRGVRHGHRGGGSDPPRRRPGEGARHPDRRRPVAVRSHGPGRRRGPGSASAIGS